MNLVKLIEIACTISVFQILLISFFLFVKKRGNRINRALIIALLSVWSVFTMGTFLLLTAGKGILLQRDIGHLMNQTIFLAAPILYIYFRVLFSSQYELTWKDLLHAIPFAIAFLTIFNEIIIKKNLQYVFYPQGIIIILALVAQNIIYFYIILKNLNLNKNNFDKAKLKLYKFFLSGALLIFVLKLVIFIIWNIFKYVEICIYLTGLFFLLAFIIINLLVIFSLNNPDLLIGVFKYQNSGISKAELDSYLEKINYCLSELKLYTDPLISLERLAKELRLPDKLLSQVINQASGLNFNDFINRYRIEYAKQLITDEDYKKILEVAYEAGFNSKTTFNNAFKKFTNLTPTEFKKQQIPASLN